MSFGILLHLFYSHACPSFELLNVLLKIRKKKHLPKVQKSRPPFNGSAFDLRLFDLCAKSNPQMCTKFSSTIESP